MTDYRNQFRFSSIQFQFSKMNLISISVWKFIRVKVDFNKFRLIDYQYSPLPMLILLHQSLDVCFLNCFQLVATNGFDWLYLEPFRTLDGIHLRTNLQRIQSKLLQSSLTKLAPLISRGFAAPNSNVYQFGANYVFRQCF